MGSLKLSSSPFNLYLYFLVLIQLVCFIHANTYISSQSSHVIRPITSSKVDSVDISFASVVRTTYGPVQGYTVFSVNHYLGIPYGAPPIGSLRFASPQPPTPWTEVRDAYLHGNVCPQSLDGLVTLGEEDCLYVNIYSPESVTPSSKLPVVVWMYGGAFVYGDGYEFGLYSGTNLVNAHDYIVVTFNYRVGAFGFMALNTLKNTDPSINSTGNAAILDQLSVLHWVQENIAAFGGDPTRVTIAGESAGAMSVCVHLASPLSKGLFNAAIMESGTCDSTSFAVDLASSIAWSVAFSQSIGCHGDDSTTLVSCLRKLPVDSFLKPLNVTQIPVLAKATNDESVVALPDLHKLPNTIQTVRRLYSHQILVSIPSVSVSDPLPPPVLYPDITWAPTVDQTVLTSTPLNMMRTGRWARVPLVIGTNKDEGTIFIDQLYSMLPNLHNPLIAADIPLILHHVFNNASIESEILQAYPVTDYPTINNLTEIVLRDFIFACPSRRVASVLSAQQIPVYLYQFDYIGDFIEDKTLGVYHSSELEFVWNNEWPPIIHTFSAQDTAMANLIGNYWSNFIINHDVNVGESVKVKWNEWSSASPQSLHIAADVFMENNILNDVCNMWDDVQNKVQQIQQKERHETLLHQLKHHSVTTTSA